MRKAGASGGSSGGGEIRRQRPPCVLTWRCEGNESFQKNFVLRANCGCLGDDVGRSVPRCWPLFVLGRKRLGMRSIHMGFCVFEGGTDLNPNSSRNPGCVHGGSLLYGRNGLLEILISN